MDNIQSSSNQNDPVIRYQKGVNKLETLIWGGASERQLVVADETANTGEVIEPKQLFATILETRSSIYASLQDNKPIDNVIALSEADNKLRITGKKVVSAHKIDLYHWRQSYGIDDSKQWWWYLDQSIATYIVWIIFTAIILFFSLKFLNPIRLLNQISTLSIQLFSSVGINEFSLETIALIGTAFQLAIGGSISIAFTRTFRSWLNQKFYDWASVPRWLLPVPSYTLIATLFIIFIAMANYLILPSLESYFDQQATEAMERGSVSSAANNINSAIATNVSSYANSLTLLGLEYENIGQNELAKETYQRALLEDSKMLGARYLLANLLLDEGNSQDAILILDEGIRQLDHQENNPRNPNPNNPRNPNPNDPRNPNPNEIRRLETQFRYLLLVTRGRAFLQLSSASLALQDLKDVKDLIEDNETLFITEEDLEGERIDALEGMNTIEFYYYYALANEARQREELDFGDETSANLYGGVAFEAWEAVIILSSQQNNDYQARLWNLEASQRVNP